MNEEEEFFAWLDGELSGEVAERVAARVAATPELAARAEQHRRLAVGLRGAFDDVMSADVPPPKMQSGEVIDLREAATRRNARRGWPAASQLAAMAASLLIGVIAGEMLFSDHPETSVAVENGKLVAAGGLSSALDTQLASAPSREGTRIGLTFRDSAGNICRSFADAASSGLACRDGSSWKLRGLFPASEGQAGDYRMAAGSDPRLAALVEETMTGEPFDAEQEQAVRDSGWR
jgi:hypothetical protein